MSARLTDEDKADETRLRAEVDLYQRRVDAERYFRLSGQQGENPWAGAAESLARAQAALVDQRDLPEARAFGYALNAYRETCAIIAESRTRDYAELNESSAALKELHAKHPATFAAWERMRCDWNQRLWAERHMKALIANPDASIEVGVLSPLSADQLRLLATAQKLTNRISQLAQALEGRDRNVLDLLRQYPEFADLGVKTS